MTTTNAVTKPRATGEAGMALVLAIMALMLLTFLGLTLAATTSTELQIATNYRWSHQALYNAEAGLEAGKAILRNMPATVAWGTIMPSWRGAGAVASSWTPLDVIPPPAGLPIIPPGAQALDQWGNNPRNFEGGNCDQRGGGVGYGVVLNDVGSLAPQGLMQNVTTVFGQRLNGAITLWVRRDTGIALNGQTSDVNSDVAIILTAEGVAPYSDGSSAMAFARANQAVRVVETYLLRAVAGASPCETYRAQVGNGVSGSNFATCSDIVLDCSGAGGVPGSVEDNLLRGMLGDVNRDAGGTRNVGSGQAGTFASLQDPNNPGNCVQ